MNRYAIQGVALDVMEGKRVGIMAITRESGRKSLRSLFEFLKEPGVVGRWANGDERVDHPGGGSASLLTANSSLFRQVPGLDVLVVLDFRFLDEHLAADIVALGQNMEIIRW